MPITAGFFQTGTATSAGTAGMAAAAGAIAGYRGRPAGDLDSLAQAIVALSHLADDPTVAEAEVNPLIVRPAGQGLVAVDALVKLAGKA
jgi:succinyl-CoA synthetase beta subunit